MDRKNRDSRTISNSVMEASCVCHALFRHHRPYTRGSIRSIVRGIHKSILTLRHDKVDLVTRRREDSCQSLLYVELTVNWVYFTFGLWVTNIDSRNHYYHYVIRKSQKVAVGQDVEVVISFSTTYTAILLFPNTTGLSRPLERAPNQTYTIKR